MDYQNSHRFIFCRSTNRLTNNFSSNSLPKCILSALVVNLERQTVAVSKQTVDQVWFDFINKYVSQFLSLQSDDWRPQQSLSMVYCYWDLS